MAEYKLSLLLEEFEDASRSCWRHVNMIFYRLCYVANIIVIAFVSGNLLKPQKASTLFSLFE